MKLEIGSVVLVVSAGGQAFFGCVEWCEHGVYYIGGHYFVFVTGLIAEESITRFLSWPGYKANESWHDWRARVGCEIGA